MTDKVETGKQHWKKYRLFLFGTFAALAVFLGRTFLNAAYSIYVLATIVRDYGLGILNDTLRNEVIANSAWAYASFSWSSLLSVGMILAMGVMLWKAAVYFMAQFVLPISDSADRQKAADRFSTFIGGDHGAAVFVKEGKIIKRKKELDLAKPGVALVDLSSAVVLSQEEDTQSWNLANVQEMDLDGLTMRVAIRHKEKKKKIPFVETRGPGVVFIEKGQKIFSVVDLRPQSRAGMVEAYTRDGIRLSTRVSVNFSLSGEPETIAVGYLGGELRWLEMEYLDAGRKVLVKNAFDLDEQIRQDILDYIKGMSVSSPVDEEIGKSASNTPYRFYPNRVFAAAYAKARRVGSDEFAPWHTVPLEIAIDIFRRKLSAIPYDELYPGLDFQQDNVDEQRPKQNVVALKRLKEDFGRAVKMRGIINVQFFGRKGNLPFQAGEMYETRDVSKYPVITLSETKFNTLRGLGVVVKSASFSDLQPVSPEIKERMIDNWKAKWEKEEHFINAEYELEAVRVRNRSRAQIQQEMTYLLASIFQSSHTDEALALRVFQALESAATNPMANTDISPKEIVAMLESLHKWLLVERNNILATPPHPDTKNEA